MQRVYGEAEVKEVCEYKPAHITINDLFDLNVEHWRQGYLTDNKDMSKNSYYIYSILAGIVFLSFNDENRDSVRDYVMRKTSKSDLDKAYLAWYDIRSGKKNEVFNKAVEVKVPFFELKIKRVAFTVDAELSALPEGNFYHGVTFNEIADRFREDVLQALKTNNMESLREEHNSFTSIMLNHIVKLRDGESEDVAMAKKSEKLFSYKDRTVKRKDGTEQKLMCDEIHFIVTHEISIAGRIKVDKKKMPTLPMITGGGRRKSSWTIEHILINTNIDGLKPVNFI